MQKIKIIFIILAKTYRTSFGTRCDFSSTGYEQCQLISREGIAYNVNQCIDTKVCIFSRNSNSRIANVRLSVCLSVHHKNQLLGIAPLTIKPIDNWAYRPLNLSTIEPINHWTYQPLSLSTIEPIDHWAYQPSLSTIEPINHQVYQPLTLCL